MLRNQFEIMLRLIKSGIGMIPPLDQRDYYHRLICGLKGIVDAHIKVDTLDNAYIPDLEAVYRDILDIAKHELMVINIARYEALPVHVFSHNNNSDY